MKNSLLTYLSWNDMSLLCDELARQINDSGYEFQCVIGIQRGGCIPAVMLCHLLEISDFYTLGIRTTISNETKASRLEVPVIIENNSLKHIRDKNVLIVDDVTNTGSTLKLAEREISKYEPNFCKTAVVIWDGDNNSKCKANYYAKYTPDWVVFPWEINK